MSTSSPSSLEQPYQLNQHSVRFAPCSTDKVSLPRSSSFIIDQGDSGDDEGGVFLGAHIPVEIHLLSKLSSDSPGPNGFRRSQVRRVKKRDSREFIRRKTLLSSAKVNSEREETASLKGKAKAWEGGFYERCGRSNSDTESDASSSPIVSRQLPLYSYSTPSNHIATPEQSDLTLDFSTFRLTDTPPTSLSEGDEKQAEEGEAVEEDEEDEDSDKENTELPRSPDTESDEEETAGPAQENGASLGMEAGLYDEGIDELDMGGLRLSDLADPEADYEQTGLAVGHSESEGLGSDDELNREDLTATDQHNLPDDESEHTIRVAAESSLVELVSEIEVSELFDTPGSDRIGVESPTTDLDSPLPISRAGPVIIPQFGSHHLPDRTIRADPYSPFRCLPSTASPTLQFMTTDVVDTSIRLAQLDSPESRKTSVPLPDSITPSAYRPVQSGWLIPRGNKVLKHVPASVDRPKTAPVKSQINARTFAIRGQLDAAFPSKLGAMGPPQRAVSSSSVSSSSSTSSASQRPALRLGGPSKGTNPLAPVRPSSTKSQRVPVDSDSRLGGSVRPSQPGRAAAHVHPPLRFYSNPFSRPTSTFAKPSTTATLPRPALVPRVLPPTAVRPPTVKYRALASIASLKPVASPSQLNSLKRPIPYPTLARSLVTIGDGRPTLGLPSRLGHESHIAPSSSGGISDGGGMQSIITRAAYKSPVQPVVKRPFTDTWRGSPDGLRGLKWKLGTPSRPLGTPTCRVLPRPVTFSLAAHSAPQDVAAVELSATAGPPVAATRQATECSSRNDSAEPVPQRWSSEDHEDVSFQLPAPTSSEPGSSPVIKQSGRTPLEPREEGQSPKTQSPTRPKRVTRPPQPPPTQRGRQAGPNPPSIAPNMSEKELKATTEHNTMRNQVYLCAIDRQIIRKSGPRPPSPTSRIRTTADRDEEERRAGREARASRRSRGNEDADDESEEDVHVAVLERMAHVRGPGDDEEYTTPARPSKKAKTTHVAEAPSKSVKWDKGLVVIRRQENDEKRPVSRSLSAEESRSRSCRRDNAKLQLDNHGNVIEATRPHEKLKRTRIEVTAVFYDGEEPVPPPGPITSGGRGRKK